MDAALGAQNPAYSLPQPFFFISPQRADEEKWLGEIKGGRSQPEGCLVHTWARGAFHDRAFVEAQEAWRKGRAQVVLAGTVPAA